LYADNFWECESSPDVTTLGLTLTENLTHVTKWWKDNKLSIAAKKSSVTLFTSWNKEVNYHPQVFLNGQSIPLNKNVIWLGQMLSSMFIMSPHIGTFKVKSSPHLQIMKAIRGQVWGDKETLRLTYQALIKPIMTHNVAILFPSVGPDATSIQELQRIQNAGMHIITGGHKMTSREHLLAQTKFLPVAKHLEMICT
jgi:hypothetical protein